MDKLIKIVSKEGIEEDITIEVANSSKYLQTVLKEDPDCKRIETSIPSKSLILATKFMNYHLNRPMTPIPKPLTDYQNFRNNIDDEFDSDLVVNLTRDDVFDLLYAAQCLQIDSLMSLIAAYAASIINGKNVSELRDFFQVEDDLTEEEKLQIDKENACFRI